MPIRLGEFTTVSTSNFYFYPPLGSSSTPQGYLLATGPTGFMVPVNPNVLTSSIVGLGYLDSSISTALSATAACLAQTSTLNTYVSINTASISAQGQQISTISTNLQDLSNYTVANIGATPALSTQVSDLTAGYSSLVYGFSSLSTFVADQASFLSSTAQTVSSLSSTVNYLVPVVATISSLSSFVNDQSTLLGQTAASLCTTVDTLSSVSSVVAGLAAGTVTVGDFTALSTYTSSLGASVGTTILRVSSLELQVSTLSTNVSSLQSVTTYLLNNSLNPVGVLALLSSQNNVFFGSNIQVSSVTSNLYFRSGNVGVGCNTPSDKFVVVGRSLFTDKMTVQSNITVTRSLSTLLDVNPNNFQVTIGNAATSDDRLYIYGGASLYGGISALGASYFYSTTSITGGNFAVNNNTLFVSSGSGRVGIGCNAPSTTLDIAGTLHVSSAAYFDENVNVSGSTHTYKLNVDYNNVFQSTPSQTVLASPSYLGLLTTITTPQVLYTQTTDVFSNYSLVFASFNSYSFMAPPGGATYWMTMRLSTNTVNVSNNFLYGPYGNGASENYTSYSAYLRRGSDFSSNDNTLTLYVSSISGGGLTVGLQYFCLTGIY